MRKGPFEQVLVIERLTLTKTRDFYSTQKLLRTLQSFERQKTHIYAPYSQQSNKAFRM